MGVHGLTTYIQGIQDRHDYKETVNIRDMPVVIDGCNLMYHLYFDGKAPVVGRGGNGNKATVEQTNSTVPNAHLYGGDWMQYAQNVRYFFQQLKHCNIKAIVIFDGAYNDTKLQVARDRFAKSVRDNVRKTSPGNQPEPGKTYTPIFLKNVFLEILAEQKIPHYQTMDEADPTIALIAKLLGQCPILSSDSDFYIFAGAVPLSLKSLRFCLKQQKASSVSPRESPEGKEGKKSNKENKVWVLEGEYISLAAIVKREFNWKDTEMLPIAALMIGNDQILVNTFPQIRRMESTKARVEHVFRWLGNQPSIDSVFDALTAGVDQKKRAVVRHAMKLNLDIYNGESGEKFLWQYMKKDIDVSAWISKELDERMFPQVTVGSGKTVNLGPDTVLNCSLREATSSDALKRGAAVCANDDGSVNVEIVQVSIPEWYRLLHIKCELQTYLLNILKNRVVFLPPQVEMYGQLGSHDFSIPIIRLTSGILLGDENEPVFLESQSKGKVLQVKILPKTKLDGVGILPSVRSMVEPKGEDTVLIGNIAAMYCPQFRLNVLLTTLGINENIHADTYPVFYDGWPASYRIWIATLMYFMKLKLYVASDSREPLKCLAVLVSIFLCIIKNLLTNPSKISSHPKNACLKAVCALHEAVSADPEKLEKIREFYKKFDEYPDEVNRAKTKKNKKSSKVANYDISIPYSLSQYLCIVYHTEMLNDLLGCPLKAPKIRYTVNNFFIYNLAKYILDKCDSCKNTVFNKIIAEVVGVDEIYDVLYEYIATCFNVDKLVANIDKDFS